MLRDCITSCPLQVRPRPVSCQLPYEGHLIVREQERREKEIIRRKRMKKAQTDEERLMRLLSNQVLQEEQNYEIGEIKIVKRQKLPYKKPSLKERPRSLCLKMTPQDKEKQSLQLPNPSSFPSSFSKRVWSPYKLLYQSTKLKPQSSKPQQAEPPQCLRRRVEEREVRTKQVKSKRTLAQGIKKLMMECRVRAWDNFV